MPCIVRERAVTIARYRVACRVLEPVLVLGLVLALARRRTTMRIGGSLPRPTPSRSHAGRSLTVNAAVHYRILKPLPQFEFNPQLRELAAIVSRYDGCLVALASATTEYALPHVTVLVVC